MRGPNLKIRCSSETNHLQNKSIYIRISIDQVRKKVFFILNVIRRWVPPRYIDLRDSAHFNGLLLHYCSWYGSELLLHGYSRLARSYSLQWTPCQTCPLFLICIVSAWSDLFTYFLRFLICNVFWFTLQVVQYVFVFPSPSFSLAFPICIVSPEQRVLIPFCFPNRKVSLDRV